MLNQNWFQDKRFVMFEGFAESQSFFGKDKRMKVKELLENFKGDNHIKIYDMHSFDTHRFNNANEAIRQFGYYTVRE